MQIPLVSRLIKKKLRKALGLDEAKLVFTGAAPISEALKQWYLGLGIELKEVYGMTETCGGCAFMDIPLKEGSVGRALPGVQIKIANDGEVLIKVPWGMVGYYKNEAKTKEILINGWIKTGDQGKINSDLSLSITGRINDAFKSDKGKYVVPGPIENILSENVNIEQVCVGGMGLPQPIVLICLSEQGHCIGQQELSKHFHQEILNLNEHLPKHERLAKVILVKDEWNVANGLLTPTLKIKRQSIHNRYKGYYQKWYNSHDIIIKHQENG